ncbi:MAG: ATP-binding protein [Acidobacteriota bacterium]
MGALIPKWRRSLGLRGRLSLSYGIAFILLVITVGIVTRSTLSSLLIANTTDVLEQEWGAVRGYLQIDRSQPIWFFDREDSEEAFFVRRLRRIFLLTDAEGNVLEVSELYAKAGVEPRQELVRMAAEHRPMWRERRGQDGVRYLIRTGILMEGRKEYLLSVGRTLADNDRILERATQTYFLATPLLIVLFSLLGWWIAGRALQPLNDVAGAASQITGDNLKLRIPSRSTGDELDHLIERFNAMVDRLENSFTQVRQFSADVSHELRTPLTTIRGELEVALMTATTKEQYQEAIAEAVEEADRLAKVVRTLLQLSQAESGQVIIAHDPVDLGLLVHDVVERFEVQAEAMNQIMRAEGGLGVIVRGDKLQLDRLVTNLLTNAMKYTQEGGNIRATVRAAAGQAILQVTDTGRGISAEHLPHIFDRLYRVPDGARDTERGLGLGLNFVSWIAKAHEGKIDVQSELGKGTMFTISFPLGKRGAPPENPAPTPRTVSELPTVG